MSKGLSGFLSFSKNIGENIDKRLSSKVGQTPLEHAKQSTADALGTAWERAIQKTVKATGDLIGNKIAGLQKKGLQQKV